MRFLLISVCIGLIAAQATATSSSFHGPLLSTRTASISSEKVSSLMRLRGGKDGLVPVTIDVAVLHIKPIHTPVVKVMVVGSCKELGEWDVAKGVQLTSSDETFPMHTATVMLPAGTEVEYKYAVTRCEPGDGIQTQWEAINRKIEVPASGTASIRSEFIENRVTDPRITDEPFQCNAQEWARWYKNHASPMKEVLPGLEG